MSPLVDALRPLAAEPTVEQYRLAAHQVVNLRQQHERLGMPDWAGLSYSYRVAYGGAMTEAGITHPVARQRVGSALRWHIGTVLRQVAPAEHLAALDLAEDDPNARLRRRRSAEQRRTVSPEWIDEVAVLLDAVAAGTGPQARKAQALRAALPDEDQEGTARR